MFFLVALHATPASLLLRDAANPCVAYGNGTIFNITSLFRWPAVVDGLEDADGKQYQYSWACGGLRLSGRAGPKNGTLAPCGGDDVAVCQHDRPLALDYDAGAVSTALWLGQFNGEVDDWTIMLPNTQPSKPPPSPFSGAGGDGIRVSKVHFVVDKTVPSPVLKMLGEEPFTEYNFEVRGACIGQPSFSSPGRYCDPSAVTVEMD